MRDRVDRVEQLLGEIEGDPRALEAVAGLVELYGEALRRIAACGALSSELVTDELVSHLLLLHDLHPDDVEARVARALEEVRPYLGSHGGGVELVGVEGGVARLRLDGTCNGCPSSTVTLRNAIEEAVLRAAPELQAVEAEGVAEPEPAGSSGLLQIGRLECPTELATR